MNENIWKTKAYIPTCKDTLGHWEKIKDLKKDNAVEKIIFNDNTAIENSIRLKRNELLVQFYEAVSRDITSNEQSAITKRLVEYSHDFYILKYTLMLAFGEENCKLIPELHHFFDNSNKDQLIRHRLGLLQFLKFNQTIDISVIQQTEKTLAYINEKLTIGIEKLLSLPESKLSNSLLTTTTHHFSQLIDWYKKNYVDENQLVSKANNEQRLEEENKLHSTLLQAIGSALMSSLNTTQQQAFFMDFKKQLSNKGLLLTALPNLLMPPSGAAKETPLISSNPNSFHIKQNLGSNLGNYATSEEIIEALNSHLGNSAHIIHPELGSTENIFSPDERIAKSAAIDLVLQINGYEAKNIKSTTGFIQKDGGILRKPIIGILNTCGVSEAERRLNVTTSIGGSHWVALIILPKKSPTDREKIFLLDSLNPNRAIPDALRNTLLNRTQHTFLAANSETDATLVTRTQYIPASFPEADIVNSPLPRVLQQDSWSCGIWAVHLGLELIKNGKLDESSFKLNFDDYPKLCRGQRTSATRQVCS